MAFSKSQLQVLKIKDFRYFIIARFLYITALRMVFTATGYLVYQITNNKAKLGLIGLSEVVPAIALALYAGVVVDKSNKRNLLLKGESAYWVISILQILFVYLFNQGIISGTQLVNSFFVFMFLGGIVRAFNGPAQNAIIAQLVSKEILIGATTVGSMSWLLAAVTGPLLAGVLLYFANPIVTFTIVSVFVTIAVGFNYFIKPTPVLMSKKVNNWSAIKEGIRFVFKTNVILNAISLDLFAVLFGGAIALLPVFAKDILHVNEFALGWLNAAEYIGSFIIAILLLFIPIQKDQGKKLLIAVAGFGVCTILFAISTNFWFSMLALICVGLFDGVSVIIRGNIMQLYTPDDMRGRVASVNSMFINSSNEIGQFESGMAAWAIGTVPSVIMGGSITLLVVAIVWWRSKTIRTLQY